MRVLLVGASPVIGTAELVTALAAEADMVVAVDGGGSVCLAAGIRPDLLVGDMDSLPPAHLAELEGAGIEILRFPADKDETDLDLALGEMRRRGAASVIVTAAFSGRLDHTLASVGALARARDLRPELIEPDARGWVLASEGRSAIELLGAGEILSLVSLVAAASVSVEGVRWPLDHARLPMLSSRGVSNVIEDDRATVTVHDGTVLVLNSGGCAPFADEG